MDTTTARWSEGIGVMEEKKAVKPQALNCPRCNSSNTKFCYYNNYNLLQPRYFCKTCRRYWTAGGSLRNVPVGGGSRKNKRSKTNHHHDHMMVMPQPSSSSNLVSQNPNQHIIQNTHGDDQDHQLIGFFKSSDQNDHYARGMVMMNSFMPSNTIMMNTCNLNGFENDDQDNNNHSGIISTTTAAPSTSARLFFPLEDLKPTLASTGENEMQGDSNCNAYWSGGGSW